MFSLFINPIPLALIFAASFGVLVHDTQIDKATSTALALPAGLAVYAQPDNIIKLGDAHDHTESISITQDVEQLHSNQPRQQTRGDEDKKYISVKKFTSASEGSEYHWPSV